MVLACLLKMMGIFLLSRRSTSQHKNLRETNNVIEISDLLLARDIESVINKHCTLPTTAKGFLKRISSTDLAY